MTYTQKSIAGYLAIDGSSNWALILYGDYTKTTGERQDEEKEIPIAYRLLKNFKPLSNWFQIFAVHGSAYNFSAKIGKQLIFLFGICSSLTVQL